MKHRSHLIVDEAHERLVFGKIVHSQMDWTEEGMVSFRKKFSQMSFSAVGKAAKGEGQRLRYIAERRKG